MIVDGPILLHSRVLAHASAFLPSLISPSIYDEDATKMAHHCQTLTDIRFVDTKDATFMSFRKLLREAAESNTLRAQKIRQVKVLLWWQLLLSPVNGQIFVVRAILFSAIFNFASHPWLSLLFLFPALCESRIQYFIYLDDRSTKAECSIRLFRW